MQKNRKLCRQFPRDIFIRTNLAVNAATVHKCSKLNTETAYAKKSGAAEIVVVDMDTFDCAAAAVAAGERVIAIDYASDIVPGGGCEQDRNRAQEEDMCRKSTLAKTLEAKRAEFYPIKSDEIIYAPDIYVFADHNGNEVPDKFWCDVGVVAAIRRPQLVNGKYSLNDLAIMTAKIQAQFTLALATGHNAIVTGAFGCGAFRNDPKLVIEIFKAVIAAGKYPLKIYFSILGGGENFRLFSAAFTRPTNAVRLIPGSAAAAAAAVRVPAPPVQQAMQPVVAQPAPPVQQAAQAAPTQVAHVVALPVQPVVAQQAAQAAPTQLNSQKSSWAAVAKKL